MGPVGRLAIGVRKGNCGLDGLDGVLDDDADRNAIFGAHQSVLLPSIFQILSSISIERQFKNKNNKKEEEWGGERLSTLNLFRNFTRCD
jgi:hypothetical protein